MGRMGSKSKGSLNEHTITRKSELKRLQEENRHHRLVIRMLIEEVFDKQTTITRRIILLEKSERRNHRESEAGFWHGIGSV